MCDVRVRLLMCEAEQSCQTFYDLTFYQIGLLSDDFDAVACVLCATHRFFGQTTLANFRLVPVVLFHFSL